MLYEVITGKLIFLLEKIGLKLPDLLIADTPEYREYYCHKYNLSPKNVITSYSIHYTKLYDQMLMGSLTS